MRALTLPTLLALCCPLAASAAAPPPCEGDAACRAVSVVPDAKSQTDRGATFIAADDKANAATRKPGVTLEREIVYPHYLWVANHTLGTVSRVNTATGKEEGRYWVGQNPSRTAVDLDGNVWIGGRNDGRLTKILWDVEKCTDRNEDGVITTAGPKKLGPLNSPQDPLADECVAWSGIPTPSQRSIRGIAAAPDGRVWFGFTGGGVQSIDPHSFELGPHYDAQAIPLFNKDTDGVWKPVVDAQGEPHTTHGGGVYGLVVDREGFLYASPMTRNRITRFNIFTKQWEAVFENTGCQNYGIALDGNDRVWVGCTDQAGGVMMFEPWSRTAKRFPISAAQADEHKPGGATGVTGLAVEPATGNVWASLWNRGLTGRLQVDEGAPEKSRWTLIPTAPGQDLRGVGFDHLGFAWTHGVSSDKAWKLDPKTNRHAKGFEKGISVGGGTHYTYSDFTGSTGLSFTAPRGTWTATIKAPAGAPPLTELRWQAFVPARTTAEIRLRPIDAQGRATGKWFPANKGRKATYAAYEEYAPESLVDLRKAPKALRTAKRFEVEVRMASTSDRRPVVNGVTLVWKP